MDLTVVIPFRPQDKGLNDVLTALNQQTGVSFEVLLVQNPPIADFAPTLPSRLNFQIQMLTSARGANRARNKGLESASTDLVFFLDSDCWPTSPNLLSHYVQLFRENAELCAAGGPYHLLPTANSLAKAYHELQIRWLQEGLRDTDLNAYNLLGGNLLVRRSRLDEMRFDENIIFGGTEREFLQRLSQHGKVIQFFPHQSVFHGSSMNLKSFLKKAYAQGCGTRYITAKLGPATHSKRFVRISVPPENLSPYLRIYQWGFDMGLGKASVRYYYNRICETLNRYLFFLQNLKFYRIREPKDR